MSVFKSTEMNRFIMSAIMSQLTTFLSVLVRFSWYWKPIIFFLTMFPNVVNTIISANIFYRLKQHNYRYHIGQNSHIRSSLWINDRQLWHCTFVEGSSCQDVSSVGDSRSPRADGFEFGRVWFRTGLTVHTPRRSHRTAAHIHAISAR